MPAERFFLEVGSFIQGEELSLEELEYHHLVHVMRARSGDKVQIVNGRGALADASVTRIEKKKAQLHVKEVMLVPEPTTHVILAQAMPRANRLDFILEKGTELGMTQLWLFPGVLSEKKNFTEHQIERMRSVTIAAMKQCGRLHLPCIMIKPPLAQWKPLSCQGWFGDLLPTAPWLVDLLEKGPIPKELLFFIGPESGFTPNETAILQKLGVKGVKLHSNILRTDTAALVALSVLAQFIQNS